MNSYPCKALLLAGPGDDHGALIESPVLGSYCCLDGVHTTINNNHFACLFVADHRIKPTLCPLHSGGKSKSTASANGTNSNQPTLTKGYTLTTSMMDDDDHDHDGHRDDHDTNIPIQPVGILFMDDEANREGVSLTTTGMVTNMESINEDELQEQLLATTGNTSVQGKIRPEASIVREYSN